MNVVKEITIVSKRINFCHLNSTETSTRITLKYILSQVVVAASRTEDP